MMKTDFFRFCQVHHSVMEAWPIQSAVMASVLVKEKVNPFSVAPVCSADMSQLEELATSENISRSVKLKFILHEEVRVI